MLFFWLLVAADLSRLACAAPPDVLVLDSYHLGESWADAELAGLLPPLKQAYPGLMPAVEYLDAKRFPGDDYLGFLKDHLVRKYAKRNVDLVLALDNPALDLLLNYPDELFPSVPVVFAGFNDYSPEVKKKRPEVTGVAEHLEFLGSVKLIQRLQPDLVGILVVHEYTSTGFAVRRAMEQALEGQPGLPRIEYAPDLPMRQLTERLSQLSKGWAVLVLAYATDGAGRVYGREESTRLFSQASPVPLYAMHEVRLGQGIVGGLLLDGRQHGQQAASLALRVLAGEPADQIPIQMSRSAPAFDDVQLRRFNIPPSRLPAGSRLINLPSTFYSLHRQVVLLTLAVLAALMVTVAVLARAVTRARRAESALRATESRYRTLFEVMAQGVVYQSADGAITAANPAAERILGLTLTQLQGRTSIDPRWRAIREDGSDFPGEMHPAMVALRTGREVPGTLMGVYHQGADSHRWIKVHATPQFEPSETSPYQVVTTFEDVTDQKEAADALVASEQRLDRLARIYQALSDTNQAIVRTDDEQALFDQICAIVQRLGDFRRVCIGLRGPDGALSPRAVAGEDAAELRLEHSAQSSVESEVLGLATDCLRLGRAVVRVGSTPAAIEEPADVGDTRSLTTPGEADACLPLRRAGDVVGVLAISSAEPSYFGQEMMRLFEEMAADISYALDNLDRDRALKDTLARLQESQERYRLIVETSNEGIWLIDEEHCTAFVNPRMAELLGCETSDLLGMRLEDFIFEEDLPAHHAEMASRHQMHAGSYERRLRRKDGDAIWARISAVPLSDENGRFRGSFGMFTDVTDRKAAEEQIASQRSFFLGILERVQDGIWVTDVEHRIMYANAGVPRIAGISTAEILGKHVLKEFPEETLEHFRPLYHQALTMLEPLPYEIHLVTPAGRPGWQAGWLVPLIEKGTFAGMICTMRDITEMRAAQAELELYRAGLEETIAARSAELKATEEDLRLILESSASGIFGVGADGYISFANPATLAQLGYSADDFVGSATHAFIEGCSLQADPQDTSNCNICQSLREGQTIRVDDGSFLHADGHQIPVIYSSHPMIRGGQIVGAVVSFLDITDRKRAEQRLRRLAEVVEGIAGVRDLAGLIDIVRVAARELTGSEGAALVLRDGDFCAYVDEDAIEPLWKGRRFPLEDCVAGYVMRQGEPLNIEDVDRDGRTPAELYGNTFVKSLCLVAIRRRDPVGAIGCYWAKPHKVTDEELSLLQGLADAAAVGMANLDLYGRLEEAKAEAERLTQVKSVFLANMSHEIRTPMNAILGLTHLLQREVRDPSQLGKLQTMSVAGRHLLAILNDILDFSKIEAGRLTLDHAEFDLEAVIQGVRALVVDQVTAKGLRLDIDADEAIARAPRLRGDATRLTQVLVNFLGNAVKFTASGSIGLVCRLQADLGDAWRFRFEIKDTGVGISQEDQTRLFQAFGQADDSPTRLHGGTGLGLAINRRLIELMDGSFGLQSELGRGSTFWFSVRLGKARGGNALAFDRSMLSGAGPDSDLPLDEVAELERRLMKEHPSARLLLVEDNPVNREVALELLRSLELNVDLAVNGAEALEMARKTVYDLILMDVQMPVLDGLEATKSIRQLPGQGSVPILAMTANAFVEDRQRCLEAGMNDHVAKPVEPRVLFTALLKWLPQASVQPRPSPSPLSEAGAGAQTPSSDSTEALARIRGLDVTLGLRSVKGRTKSLERLLRTFAAGHEGDIQSLRLAIATDDWETARRVAHTLKGVSATLGATLVQGGAADLEAAIKKRCPVSELEPLIAVLDEALVELVGDIAQQLPVAVEAQTLEHHDDSAVIAALTELAALLAVDDTRAAQLMQSKGALIRAAAGEAGDRLQAQIEGFDYQGALATLEELRRVLGRAGHAN